MTTFKVIIHKEKMSNDFLKMINIKGLSILVSWYLYQIGEVYAYGLCQQLTSKKSSDMIIYESKTLNSISKYVL